MLIYCRIEWLDNLKGFGVLCVLLGHLSVFPFAERYFYSFHMPLFFFISGFLYKRQMELYGYWKKKFSALMIPFLFWNMFSLIMTPILHIPGKEAILGTFF